MSQPVNTRFWVSFEPMVAAGVTAGVVGVSRTLGKPLADAGMGIARRNGHREKE